MTAENFASQTLLAELVKHFDNNVQQLIDEQFAVNASGWPNYLPMARFRGDRLDLTRYTTKRGKGGRNLQRRAAIEAIFLSYGYRTSDSTPNEEVKC